MRVLAELIAGLKDATAEDRLRLISEHVAKVGVSTDHMMRFLSDDAKVVAGGCFGVMGIPGKSEMTFHMRQSKPSPRMQAALNELVAAGAMTCRPFNQFGGITYTVAVNMSDFAKWLHKNINRADCRFPIVEPIAKAADATP